MTGIKKGRHPGRVDFRETEGHVQRPRGGKMLGTFEEQRGGPSGWRRVREGAEVGGKVGAAAQVPATRGFQVETN